MGWKATDGPSNYLLFKRGQRGDCEGKPILRPVGGRTSSEAPLRGEDAALLGLVAAIKSLISVQEVHSGRQLKLKV